VARFHSPLHIATANLASCCGNREEFVENYKCLSEIRKNSKLFRCLIRHPGGPYAGEKKGEIS
jgi:coenzyme F420-reducing hydrogenase gamma subunit